MTGHHSTRRLPENPKEIGAQEQKIGMLFPAPLLLENWLD